MKTHPESNAKDDVASKQPGTSFLKRLLASGSQRASQPLSGQSLVSVYRQESLFDVQASIRAADRRG